MLWHSFLKRLHIKRHPSSINLHFSRTFASVNMATRDPSTRSNYGAWRTKHTTVNFTLDFEEKRLKGSVLLQLESQTDRESTEVILDSRFVSVSAVNVNSKTSDWELKPHAEPLGAPLHIAVPNGAPKGELIDLTIEVETTEKCTALQWLTPAQTSNKKHPYMFSQCQAINARSIFPCQDTPDVKSTFTFNLTSTLPVVASGVPVGDHEAVPGTSKLYKFEQKVPIPSYLFAVASGDIATASIGPRSVVATGPNELQACKWELERDMEKFMEVAENLVFPYRWGAYNVLVLPPSFPYGGELSVCGSSCQFDWQLTDFVLPAKLLKRHGESHLHLRDTHHYQRRSSERRRDRPRTSSQLEWQSRIKCQLGTLVSCSKPTP